MDRFLIGSILVLFLACSGKKEKETSAEHGVAYDTLRNADTTFVKEDSLINEPPDVTRVADDTVIKHTKQ